MPDTIEHAPVPALVASSAADPIPPQDKGQPGLQKKDFEELNERLLAMPRDVGWLMVSIGVIGVALPGIVGAVPVQVVERDAGDHRTAPVP